MSPNAIFSFLAAVLALTSASATPVRFYKDVGQHLRNWVAPAPKVKKEQPQRAEEKQDEIRISPFESLLESSSRPSEDQLGPCEVPE